MGAPPAVIVMCPGATAVRIGGLSVDKLTTVESLVVHVNPVTGCPAEFTAWMVWVSPTITLSMSGTSVAIPPGTGVVRIQQNGVWSNGVTYRA
jgi:hypothetical protein